eukprot:scaffold10327_cov147-Skeletonema_marinoi.AAC.2
MTDAAASSTMGEAWATMPIKLLLCVAVLHCIALHCIAWRLLNAGVPFAFGFCSEGARELLY